MIQDSPINRVPKGLLGFLDIKAMGKNPSRFAEQTAGVVETTPFYLTDGERLINDWALGTVVLAGRGFDGSAALFTVPQNKIWLVSDISSQLDLMAVGNTIGYAHAQVNSQLVPKWIGDLSVWAANIVPFKGDRFEVPLIGTPGDRFGIFVTQIVANQTLSLALRVTEVDL